MVYILYNNIPNSIVNLAKGLNIISIKVYIPKGIII